MKFQLDQKVIFEGKEVVIWDYSLRYKNYDILFKNGKIIFGIREEELKSKK